MLNSSKNGNASNDPPSQDMRVSAAHSLGSQAEVGVRSTATKSTKFRKSSGRTRRSGLKKRNSTTTPAAANSPIKTNRSRALRAGNTFTRSKVTPVPSTAGTTRKAAMVRAAST